MDWTNLHAILDIIQHTISFVGVLVIFAGVLFALGQYIYYMATNQLFNENSKVNAIRLNLGRILILGLEFIIAADLIGTTTTPDYYAVGILASIVLIRTLLTFTLNKEMTSLEVGSVIKKRKSAVQ